MPTLRRATTHSIIAVAAALTATLPVPVLAQETAGGQRFDWPSHNLDLYGSRYAAIDQIDTTNAGRLEPAWSVEMERDHVITQVTPVVVDGVLYSATRPAPPLPSTRRAASRSGRATSVPTRSRSASSVRAGRSSPPTPGPRRSAGSSTPFRSGRATRATTWRGRPGATACGREAASGRCRRSTRSWAWCTSTPATPRPTMTGRGTRKLWSWRASTTMYVRAAIWQLTHCAPLDPGSWK